MAFIGTPLDTRNTFQSLQGKRFNGDGSTTAFTLDVAPSSTLDIEVFVGNVRQDPNSAYTLSGTTLTFTGAPPSGTNNIYVVHQAKSVGTINAPDNSVDSAQLNTALLTGATDIGADIADADLFLIDDGAGGTLRKTAASRIKTYAGFDVSSITGATELAATPASTDEFVISAGGELKRLDAAFMQNAAVSFGVKISGGDHSISNATNTVINFGSEDWDNGSDYDTTNKRFVAPEAGYYFFHARIYMEYGNDANEIGRLQIANGGTAVAIEGGLANGTENQGKSLSVSTILSCSASDQIDARIYHNQGGTQAIDDDSDFSYFVGFKL